MFPTFRVSTDDHESAGSVHPGRLKNKFHQLGKFISTESVNNEDQLCIYTYPYIHITISVSLL